MTQLYNGEFFRGDNKFEICGLIKYWKKILIWHILVAAGAPTTDDFDAADVGDGDDYPDELDTSNYKKPTFTSEAQHFRVRLGDSVRLPCEVDELGPGYTLLWKREEGDILTAGSLLIVKVNFFFPFLLS